MIIDGVYKFKVPVWKKSGSSLIVDYGKSTLRFGTDTIFEQPSRIPGLSYIPSAFCSPASPRHGRGFRGGVYIYLSSLTPKSD